MTARRFVVTAEHQGSSELLTQLAAGSLDGTWRLEPSQSSASIRTKSVWGLVTVKGVFTDLRGEATVAHGAVTATITISSGSIDTKNRKRDNHLRSADLLDSERFPDITFALDSVTPSASGIKVSGSLTVQQVTKPLVIDLAFTAANDSTITLAGSLQVNRSDFGVDWNQLGMASMVNTVDLAATFARG
jgi:polyisoprenoid-binding protein YceI